MRQQKKTPLVFQPSSSGVTVQKSSGKGVLVYEEGGETETDFDNTLLEMQSKQRVEAIQVEVKDVYEVRQDNKEGSTLHLTLLTDEAYQVGMNLAFFV